MKISKENYSWEIDFFADEANSAERFGGKKRSELKDSDFMDPKRRSFPVMSCQDVKDAVSAWGRYTGSMTFEEFKEKLTRRAKSLGCEGSLPEKWKEESKSAESEGVSDKQKTAQDKFKEMIQKKKKGPKDSDDDKDDDKKLPPWLKKKKGDSKDSK
jgi:hypothetical protein